MDKEANANYFVMQEDFKNLDLSVDGGENNQILNNIKKGKTRQRKETTNNLPVTNGLKTENNKNVEPNQTGSNRRFLLRPRKRVLVNTKEDESDLVNLYNFENKRPKLDTSRNKLKRTDLETIFEEPVTKKNGSVMLTSVTRVRRSINFPDFITKTKQKKRKAQIKKFKNKKNKSKPIRFSLTEVQTKLNEITSEDTV